MAKKCLKILITAYVLIIFLIFPFYLQNGYVDIGDAKYRFFLYVSVAVLALSAPLVIGDWIRSKCHWSWKKVSGTDLFAGLFCAAAFVSCTYSDFRKEAFYGAAGWHIGFLLYLLLVLLYFLISRYGDCQELLFWGLMISSSLVFLLGIVNRFSVYPAFFSRTDSAFLSTIGNINWYCGFLSVIVPVQLTLFVIKEQRKGWRAGYAWIAFLAAGSQGADSVFLFLATCFLFLLWISLEKKEWLKSWGLLVILFGAAESTLFLLRKLLPDCYNYETENLCGYLTEYPMGFLILAIGFALFCLIRKATPESTALFQKRVTRWQTALVVLAALLVVLAVALTALHFDEKWGNGRGAALMTGASIFERQTIFHKLFGIGEDCLSTYAYKREDLAAFLYENFGNAVLTNTHNECLTLLVNIGIVGTVCYLGMLGSFVKKCFMQAKKDPVCYVYACCVICYFVHNMVSFQQILNLPYLFVFMGLGSVRLTNEENMPKISE